MDGGSEGVNGIGGRGGPRVLIGRGDKADW